MIGSLEAGIRKVAGSWGLVLLLLAVNLSLAAMLAVPLATTLEADLRNRPAGSNMLYGFDHAWWSRWSDDQRGFTRSFAPDVFGTGFAFKNLDLLLAGRLPAGILRADDAGAAAEPPPDEHPGVGGVILSVGLLYLVLQTFLAGGLLGILRHAQTNWTVRGLLHGSGFYFGRFLRILAIALVAQWLLFRLNVPLVRFAEHQAREAVSENTALAWMFGRHALLLLAVLFVGMVSSYAKVIVVVEERSSALLAFLSSASFCARHLLRAFGHYLSIVLLGVLLLLVWSVLDGAWSTVGYKTQLVTLVLAQALVAGRIGLRLALLAGQVDLYRRLTAPR
jgi:hypothetical protein